MSSPKTISGQSQNDFGTMGEEVVPKSRIPIDTGLWDYPAPCDLEQANSEFKAPIEVIPGQTRILLSEAASRHLDATGEECFMIVTKARVPDMVGRWVIHLVPCSMQTARNAESVLMGKARAVKVSVPR